MPPSKFQLPSRVLTSPRHQKHTPCNYRRGAVFPPFFSLAVPRTAVYFQPIFPFSGLRDAKATGPFSTPPKASESTPDVLPGAAGAPAAAAAAAAAAALALTPRRVSPSQPHALCRFPVMVCLTALVRVPFIGLFALPRGDPSLHVEKLTECPSVWAGSDHWKALPVTVKQRGSSVVCRGFRGPKEKGGNISPQRNTQASPSTSKVQKQSRSPVVLGSCVASPALCRDLSSRSSLTSCGAPLPQATTEVPTSSSSSSASAASDQDQNDTGVPLISTQDQALSETSSVLSTAATDGSAVPPAGPGAVAASASGDGGEAEAGVVSGCGGGGIGRSECCKNQKKQECTASRAREPR